MSRINLHEFMRPQIMADPFGGVVIVPPAAMQSPMGGMIYAPQPKYPLYHAFTRRLLPPPPMPLAPRAETR